jgi:hypothetical protein
MRSIPAHKSSSAAQIVNEPLQGAMEPRGHVKTFWMNIYRAGHFHRAGKPTCVDRHAGDFYETREAAMAEISPRSHYITTVPFTYVDSEDVRANAADSVPTPLSVSRAMSRAIEEARVAGHLFTMIPA